jgi:hypothetical protein
MRPLTHQLVFVVALSLVASVATAQQTAPQTREAVIQEITVRGTVDAIDHTARTVRIRGDQGNIMTLDVPTSVTRFDSMKVGDVVTIAYYDRVNLRLKPSGEPAVDRVVDPTTTITPGLLPGGVRSTQRVTTVTIDSWDPATRMVGFTTSSGQSYTRRVSETIDASVLAGLKVGDRVDVTRTEATRLTVETLAAPAPQPLPVALDTLRDRVTISFLWGPDNQVSGKVFQGSSGVFNDGTPITFDETTYDEIYGRMSLLKIGVGYRISPRTEATFNFVYSKSGSEPFQVGTVGVENSPLTADLEDYSYWGLEGGQRFYFTRVRFTPFVGYNLGINRFTHIDGNFFAPAIGSQPAVEVVDARVFDSSWAFSFGPTGGVLIGLGPIELQGEVGFRYMGGLSDVDFLVNADLRDINAESSRWSFPILFGIRVRF